MKKIIALTTVLGLYCMFRAKKAYAWSSVTHEDIAKKALDLLEKDKKSRPAAFYKNYRQQILKGCTEPDNEHDPDCGLGTHYYSAYTPKGKELPETNGYYKNRLGKFARSARTMLEENYTSALNLYKSGDKENAMRVIGRAAHFISDMGCTVHAANMRYLPKSGNVHHAFEKHVSTTCVKQTAESCDKRLTKYYSKDSFCDAVNKLVKYSGKFTEAISNLDPKAFDDVSKNTLTATQQNVAALLLKFYDDCSSDNGNFVEDHKLYTFKNEVSGLVLTVTPKGLQLEKADKTLEQKLEIRLGENGALGLKIADGGYVNASCKGYDYLKIDGKPAQFRIAALGKKRFRIHSESSKFEKVLTNAKGGKLAFADFDPENPAQIWILN